MASDVRKLCLERIIKLKVVMIAAKFTRYAHGLDALIHNTLWQLTFDIKHDRLTIVKFVKLATPQPGHE